EHRVAERPDAKDGHVPWLLGSVSDRPGCAVELLRRLGLDPVHDSLVDEPPDAVPDAPQLVRPNGEQAYRPPLGRRGQDGSGPRISQRLLEASSSLHPEEWVAHREPGVRATVRLLQEERNGIPPDQRLQGRVARSMALGEDASGALRAPRSGPRRGLHPRGQRLLAGADPRPSERPVRIEDPDEVDAGRTDVLDRGGGRDEHDPGGWRRRRNPLPFEEDGNVRVAPRPLGEPLGPTSLDPEGRPSAPGAPTGRPAGD